MQKSRRFLDSLWECESDGDGFGTSVSILDVASNIWNVCEALWLPLASSYPFGSRRAVVGSDAMDQSVLQRASPVLSGVSPCRTAWGARKQHKTANMVRHWSTRCGNSAACLLSGWVAIQLWFCYNATMLSGTYCNALRVLQEPMTSWNVLNSSVVCIPCEPAFSQAFSACCSALRILPTDGCISPVKLEACSPVWLSVMACLEAAPWPLCFLIVIAGPPFKGGSDFFDYWFVIAVGWMVGLLN